MMMGAKGAMLLLGLTSMHAVGAHSGAVKVLRVGHNQVMLPVKSAETPRAVMAQVEAAAIQATGGGQVQAIRASVWTGRPVWMCTVKSGTNVWHVMVDRTTYQTVSKIRVSE